MAIYWWLEIKTVALDVSERIGTKQQKSTNKKTREEKSFGPPLKK